MPRWTGLRNSYRRERSRACEQSYLGRRRLRPDGRCCIEAGHVASTRCAGRQVRRLCLESRQVPEFAMAAIWSGVFERISGSVIPPKKLVKVAIPVGVRSANSDEFQTVRAAAILRRGNKKAKPNQTFFGVPIVNLLQAVARGNLGDACIFTCPSDSPNPGAMPLSRRAVSSAGVARIRAVQLSDCSAPPS